MNYIPSSCRLEEFRLRLIIIQGKIKKCFQKLENMQNFKEVQCSSLIIIHATKVQFEYKSCRRLAVIFAVAALPFFLPTPSKEIHPSISPNRRGWTNKTTKYHNTHHNTHESNIANPLSFKAQKCFFARRLFLVAKLNRKRNLTKIIRQVGDKNNK